MTCNRQREALLFAFFFVCVCVILSVAGIAHRTLKTRASDTLVFILLSADISNTGRNRYLLGTVLINCWF